MFTGLVETLGRIDHVTSLGDGSRMTITHLGLPVAEGDSVAVNGVCSTAVDIQDNAFSVDYLPETLSKTTCDNLSKNDTVNLETALTLQTKLGGHFVTGHVDCVGDVIKFTNADELSPFGEIIVKYPKEFAAYLIPKGSITIDGVSLTIVDLTDSTFSCHLIPETLSKTVLKDRPVGSQVNLEYDMLGKYVVRQMEVSRK
ncbi:riboflavin synthase [bacterium]|jgi:riboflavin synthase|nr:riboflavin synthase [bacterium]